MSRGAERSGAAGTGGLLLGVVSTRVLLPEGPLRPATVWIDETTGTIAAIWEAGHRRTGSPEGRIVSLEDRVLAPGFVDVHVHGGAGLQVNASNADDAEAAVLGIAAFHACHGTTSLVATTVSDTAERLLASVEGVARAARRSVDARASGSAPGARVLGSHLEGPFISPARAGAQDPAQIRPPDLDELAHLLEAGGGTVRIVTLAPELDGADDLVAESIEAGVIVSLGHSDADYECARAAFDTGASHVAHLFDAMAPLHHRAPGLVGAALSDGTVTVEVICDLHHVHPAVVEMVAAAAADRTLLVTDATAAAGMPPGPLTLGPADAVLCGTMVRLASEPGTLAGSALTMDAAVRHAVGRAHLPLESALRAASSVPAQLVRRFAGGGGAGPGTPLGIGTIASGAPADLVVLDEGLDAVATVVGGRVVFDPFELVTLTGGGSRVRHRPPIP